MPSSARLALELLVTMLETLRDKIAELDLEVGPRAKEDQAARRLMTTPGIGLVTATALVALAPDASSFKYGRDFVAWLGLTPRQHSTERKQKLGAASKMGERTLRRLLIIGPSVVVRQAQRRGVAEDTWLSRMLTREPPLLVMVALPIRWLAPSGLFWPEARSIKLRLRRHNPSHP